MDPRFTHEDILCIFRSMRAVTLKPLMSWTRRQHQTRLPDPICTWKIGNLARGPNQDSEAAPVYSPTLVPSLSPFHPHCPDVSICFYRRPIVGSDMQLSRAVPMVIIGA